MKCNLVEDEARSQPVLEDRGSFFSFVQVGYFSAHEWIEVRPFEQECEHTPAVRTFPTQTGGCLVIASML